MIASQTVTRATDTRPIEQACYWLAGRRRDDDPPLVGRRETDIVIIGAGFTGLWTALFLKHLDPAREIVVLEQGVAAYGASGRNAGMIGARRSGWRGWAPRTSSACWASSPSAASSATWSVPAS